MDALQATASAFTHVWNLGVGCVHAAVAARLPRDGFLAAAATGVLVAGAVAIPLSLAFTGMAMLCVLACRRVAAVAAHDATLGATHRASTRGCSWCGPRALVLKLRMKDGDAARRLVVTGHARTRLRELERVVLAKLMLRDEHDAAAQASLGAHTKVSRLTLLPDGVVLAEDADLVTLGPGKELLAEVKE